MSRVPSGDHAKLETPRVRPVSRRGSPPFIASSQTWLRAGSADSPAAARADRKAIVRPSGLHRGLLDDCAARVSCAGGSDPSAATVQISLWRRFCLRSIVVTTYAIVDPSG